MDIIGKKFKNRVTGEIITIIDVYQNIAVTSNKDRINTNILLNEKLFIPISDSNSSSNSSSNNSLIRESKANSEEIDPAKFFDSQNTYNAFAEKIKNLPLDKLPMDDGVTSTSNVNTTYDEIQASNESAIIMSDTEDEVEELKRKYGATSVDDSLRKQNEKFDKILNPETQVTTVTTEGVKPHYMETEQEAPIQRIDVQDPVLNIFRNVKRNLDFKMNLKIDNKIPRLDFIEMMEDSYEVSIIDYLAEEFTRTLLNNPSIIKNKIIEEIKSMIDKKNTKIPTKTNDSIIIPATIPDDREKMDNGLLGTVVKKKINEAKIPKKASVRRKSSIKNLDVNDK